MIQHTRTLRRSLGIALCLAGSALFGADSYSFALIGDQPYVPTVTTADGFIHQQYPPSSKYINLINSINADLSVLFTVHVGDIKAGNTLCESVEGDDLDHKVNVYAHNLALFNTFLQPLIYAPGDNEWTDCHRINNGSYHPLDRLALIRSTFFTDSFSLGINRRLLARQSDSNPGKALYRENAKWIEGPVLFVTLNMPGSNNNHQQVYQGVVPCGPVNGLPCTFTEDEYLARNDANMSWLNQAVQDAKANPAIKGVAIMIQANPFERFLEPTSSSNPIVYTESGYADFISRLRGLANSSNLQILFVNGDTHTQRTNHPLTDVYPSMTQLTPDGTPFANFTRTEVFGQNNVHWTKVTVDGSDPRVFTAIDPIIIPANCQAAPKPCLF